MLVRQNKFYMLMEILGLCSSTLQDLYISVSYDNKSETKFNF